ncbi:AraC family transcriptional regulator [Stenotrophomonas sp. 364]|nr:AraC family transcriptional regulator [Stenotrophomonas sp. 364]
MDPLSDLLSLLHPVATVSSGFRAGGAWSVEFSDQHGQIKCYAILEGACWMAVDGVKEPWRLAEGDSFVLPRGRPFRLASDLSLPPIDSSTLFPPANRGGAVVLADGAGFSLAGARFAVTGSQAPWLLGLLPPAIHLRVADDRAVLRWAVERMMQEMRESKPGGMLLAQNLAQTMLVHALRAHLSEAGASGAGLLAALADPRLSRALQAIHAHPARKWTLRSLAAEAGMSRTVFATQFRAAMGETAMLYLTRWRMALACDQLEHSRESVAQVGSSLGYDSISAFSTAFKRVLGISPLKYKSALSKQPRLAPSTHPP